MKFTVIVTAHNLKDYIGRALDSIKEQSYKDYELIVVCDACEDETEKIVRPAA
jgi:glycosyltransferase involved in cell wall biosynthesis